MGRLAPINQGRGLASWIWPARGEDDESGAIVVIIHAGTVLLCVLQDRMIDWIAGICGGGTGTGRTPGSLPSLAGLQMGQTSRGAEEAI